MSRSEKLRAVSDWTGAHGIYVWPKLILLLGWSLSTTVCATSLGKAAERHVAGAASGLLRSDALLSLGISDGEHHGGRRLMRRSSDAGSTAALVADGHGQPIEDLMALTDMLQLQAAEHGRATCVDDDNCLQAKWTAWSWTKGCAASSSYCTGDWAADMEACCQKTCGVETCTGLVVAAAAKDDDSCLKDKWKAWSWSQGCASSVAYCSGTYSGDMQACCGATCATTAASNTTGPQQGLASDDGGQQAAAAEDDDSCLKAKWRSWFWSRGCSSSSEYCNGAYAADMTGCCPKTCGVAHNASAHDPAGVFNTNAAANTTAATNASAGSGEAHLADNSACLRRKWQSFGWTQGCTQSSAYCEDKQWSADMKACCPQTCEGLLAAQPATDNDGCLKTAWASWSWSKGCQASESYCLGDWAKDMASCCPSTCMQALVRQNGVNSDACLKTKWSAWKWKKGCAASVEYCDSAWSAEMRSCCPSTCLVAAASSAVADSDQCLQGRWAAWRWKKGCAESGTYCVGSYAADMAACCPSTCLGSISLNVASADNDACLQTRWAKYSWDKTCAASADHCLGSWSKDMRDCCPSTCVQASAQLSATKAGANYNSTCSNDDKCLADKMRHFGWDKSCDMAWEYCQGQYASQMRACCPKTCGTGPCVKKVVADLAAPSSLRITNLDDLASTRCAVRGQMCKCAGSLGRVYFGMGRRWLAMDLERHDEILCHEDEFGGLPPGLEKEHAHCYCCNSASLCPESSN
eukprot:TRINITY_DN82077_c0_g1_i1.p1 TRINITY_DN82077_c0_g1~~TRINITY_DN82077_c0_g1_i1.p1  ORF type:complete len:750 (+),score=147.39 TRINITY_DN82077_c0_g1_i1:55-2304(+)